MLSKPAVSIGAKPRRQRFADDRIFFLVSFAPTMVVTATIIFLPMVFILYLSLFNRNLLAGAPVFIGLNNYWDALHDPVFWLAFQNGMIYSFGSTLLSVVAGLLAALILNEEFKGRGFLRSAVVFPYVVPTIVVVLLWKFMFNSRGVINQVLFEMGIVKQYTSWLGDQRFSMITVILISTWTWFPFAAINLLAGLQGIPIIYYEAAALDGAGPIQRFFSLTLPLLAPILIVVILLRSIWAFRNFDMIFLLTRGGPLTSTYILPILIYDETFGKFRLGYGSAVATLLILFLSLSTFVYFAAYSATKKIAYD